MIANGKKHLSQKEIKERLESEVKPKKPPKPPPAPKYLPEDLKSKFRKLAKELHDEDIFTALDADTLARYLLSERAYIQACDLAYSALGKDDADLEAVESWSRTQERLFKQCRSAAADLGLTITSRCRLVVPKKQAEKEVDDMFGDKA